MKRVIWVSLALAVSVACTSQGSVKPAGSPSSEGSPDVKAAIVFNVFGSDPAVYSIAADGSGRRRIRGIDDAAILSPDGTRFVDTVVVDGTRTPATYHLDGSGYEVLEPPDPTLQVGIGPGGWSPDGTQFLAVGWDDTDPSSAGLYTFSSRGGGELVRLTEPGNPPDDSEVAWSPDGSWIMFLRQKKPYDHSGPMNVLVVRKDGSGLVRVNPPGTTSWLDAQSWSPNGREIALVASRGAHPNGSNAVFVVDVGGAHARRVTPWNHTLRAQWSPDGSWIAFDMAESEPVPRDLFVVRPDGSGLRQVTSNEDGKMSFAPVWSADSSTLLFVRREYAEDLTDLWTVNVDGTGLFQLTHSPSEYTGYRWLP